MKKANVLYLREMGMDDNNISTDIKNHRVRVLENIDILYNGKKYNMFFEFLQGTHWHYRTDNKRNGKPLKKAVYEIDLVDGMFLDTEYKKIITDSCGTFEHSFRNSKFEKEFFNEHLKYTKENVLKVVNRYKIGDPFTSVCLVETAAREIIKRVGGFRELDILGEDRTGASQSYFKIGDTWNDEHKIMRCVKRENWKDVDFCEVDLVTGRITG